MKGNFLHIGSAVLGFLFVVQNASAQVPPETDRMVQIFPEEVSQIDAEEASVESVDEVSSGNEGSHIRFSDTDRVAPAIQVPSQQSMSSLLVQEGYLLDVQYESLLEQHSIRPSSSQTGQQNQQNQRYRQDQQNQRYQDNQQDNQQDQRYQRDQDQQRRQQDQRDQQRRQQDQQDQRYQQDDQENQRYQRNDQDQQYRNEQQNQQRRQDQDQRRDQQQRDQRNQRNENGWNRNEGSVCPNTDDERCFYPESQRKRCELFDGIYIDGVCYMRDDRNTRHDECERNEGVYINDQCYMENRQNNARDRDQGTDRERCEDMGGQYRNGSCSIEYDEYDRYQRNSWKGGEDDALVSTIPLVRTEKRKACEDKGGEYLGNGKCVIRHYDQDKCEEKNGIFYEDECFLDSKEL